MLTSTSIVRVACVLTSMFAVTAFAVTVAHAQAGGDEPPSWETGEEAQPPAGAAPSEHPPDSEAPPEDEAADEAEDDQSPVDARAEAGLVIGAKVGGGIGTGDFGATPVFELELGYAPDLGASLGRSLEIFLIGQYAQPGLDGSSEPDPRFPGGAAFSYEVTQQMLSLSLGALLRFDLGSDLLMPYGGLGARMYLLNTKVKADAMGEPLGESRETRTDFGLVLLGGLDVFVGPGALLGELSFGWAALDAYILRDTNVGALSLAVGYRVML